MGLKRGAPKKVHPYNKMIWCGTKRKHLKTELSEPLDLRFIGVKSKQGEARELVHSLLWIGQRGEIYSDEH